MTFNFAEHPAGWIAATGPVTYFFGNRHSSLSELQSHFPRYRFLRTKQIHGRNIIAQNEHATDYEIEADGSWTTQPMHAVCSISADCVPILLSTPDQKFVMALHAGWRGVASRILPHALEIAEDRGYAAEEIHFAIGPHIGKESFEVRQDALDLLRTSTNEDPQRFVQSLGQGQYLVDLCHILKAQAAEFAVTRDQIHLLDIDTLTDTRLNSHRRDREKAGRQISFIVLESGS